MSYWKEVIDQPRSEGGIRRTLSAAKKMDFAEALNSFAFADMYASLSDELGETKVISPV